MNAPVRDLPAEFTIPSTTDELTSALDGLGALVTAEEWERAAIVWAWVKDAKPGPKTETGSKVKQSYGVREFTALGLHGLKSHVNVIRYRRAWQWAIDESTVRDHRAVLEAAGDVRVWDVAAEVAACRRDHPEHRTQRQVATCVGVPQRTVANHWRESDSGPPESDSPTPAQPPAPQCRHCLEHCPTTMSRKRSV